MSWYWYVIGFISLLFFLLLVTNTKLEILFQRQGDENDYLLIKATILYFINVKKEFPIIDVTKKGDRLGIQFNTADGKGNKKRRISFRFIRKIMKRINALMRNLHHFLIQVKKILKGFKIVKFSWSTHIGISDAAILGTTIGGVWFVKGTILQRLFYFFPLLNQPTIHVNPEFQQSLYKTRLHCIFQFKVGYAIYAGLKFFYLYLKGARHV